MARQSSSEQPLNRRAFLGSSAWNAAGVAAGVVGWSALSATPGIAGANERVRVGIIGIRNQGKLLATELAKLGDVEVAALCDVDEPLLAATAKGLADRLSTPPRLETDFRRLLDDPQIHALVIATPDHWHATLTTLACAAGKDVYVESPVSHVLSEGSAMIAAAAQTGRIVQTGLQHRSGSHFVSAIEYLKGGGLGQVHLAKAWTVNQRKSIGQRPDGLPPEGVDYDRWLGPAAARAFNPNRFHFNWHWFWEYGSGELGTWGVHLLDVARWGLGVDYPTQVAAHGGIFHFQDDRQTPDTLHVSFAFPQASMTWEHRLWSPHSQEGRSAAVAFYGDRGTLIVDRGGWKVYGQRDAHSAEPGELLGPHLRNFIDCVKSRTAPVAGLSAGLVSSDLCHLGNIAYRMARSLDVDPQTGEILRDKAAQGLASVAYRAPWSPASVS